MVTSLTSVSRALRIILLTGFALLVPLFSGRTAAAEVTATLQDNSIKAGDETQLNLEITNGNPTALKAPQVADLVINQRGHSSSTVFENGRMTSSLTVIYSVQCMKPGEYTIPPFSVTVDGVEMKTAPLKLKVLPSSAQPPQGMPQGNSGAGPRAPDTAEAGSFGFVTVEPALKDRNYAWVGEIAPVRIKAWVPDGSQIVRVAKVQPAGSAFTLHNLSERPQQAQEIRNGKRYTVLTYYAGLSAAKAGSYVPDLSLSAVALVRDPNSRQRQRMRRDAFGNVFPDPFDDFFTPTVQKDVELKTRSGDDSSIEVRALPLKGRPADFNGAVGKFAFEHIGLPDQWQTGEPQTITAIISGEGNFNLLAQPELQPAKDWKSYSGQSEFTPKDAASFTGSQSFRFTSMPRKGGPQKAHLEFSYFDPGAGRYETVKSPIQNLEVRGENLADETPAPAAAVAPKNVSDANSPAPLHGEDSSVRSLMPFAFRPSFAVVLGSSGAVAVAGLLAGWVRIVRRDPLRIAREKAIKAEQAAMHEVDSFASRGDVAGFFAAARRALQVKLATLWSRPAQAITLADVTARIPADSPVITFFREADRLTYSPSGEEPRRESLTAWRTRLQDALHSLATPLPIPG
jgi:hypothetical protein